MHALSFGHSWSKLHSPTLTGKGGFVEEWITCSKSVFLTLDTLGVSVSCETNTAWTLGPVIFDGADCLGGTGVPFSAWIDTSTVPARSWGRAIAVWPTSSFNRSSLCRNKNLIKFSKESIITLLTYQFTSFISLPGISGFASANHNSKWELILHSTFSILDTRLDVQAGVQAFSIKASFLARTITVSVTSWFFNNWLWDC